MTKVLVVFCAVLSLVLAALTMAYASNADRIRGSIDDERVQRIQYQSTAASQIEGFARERASIEEQLRTSDAQVKDLNALVNTLQAERTELRSQVERATAAADANVSNIAQLGATSQTQATLIQNYRDEVTKLRDELVTASRREIEYVDRINDLSSQREVIEQNARALKEQLEEARLAVQGGGAGAAGPGGAGGAMEAREFTGPLVRARVLEVVSSPTGDLVVISEGANRGLKENMLMHVVRGGDQFVGSITLTKVEPGTAVGRLNMYGRKDVQVSRDDLVLSRLQ